MLVLKIVDLGAVHGYGIIQRLRDISQEALQVRQAPLYPALYRLEKRGWSTGEWKITEGGREAKFYRFTKVGRRQLQAEEASWDRLCSAISLVLKAAN